MGSDYATRLARPLAVTLLIALAVAQFALIPSANVQLADFGAFVFAGRAVRAGTNPYAVSYLLGNITSSSPNLNPPISLLFFALLAPIDPVAGLTIWRVSAVAMYGLVVFLLLRENRRWRSPVVVAWLSAFAPFVMTVGLGQIYTVLLLLVAFTYRLQRTRYAAIAGASLGFLIAWKPNYVVWPLFLAASGEFAVGVSALLVAIALSIIPLVAYGPIVYRQWLDAIGLAGWQDVRNVSLIGVADAFEARAAGFVVAAILGALLLGLVYRYRPNPAVVGGLALLAGTLLAPIGWASYALLLLPWLSNRSWSRGQVVGVGLLSIPLLPLYLLATTTPLGLALARLPYVLGFLVLAGIAIRDCIATVPRIKRSSTVAQISQTPALSPE
jgi:hypothetical protein